MFPLHKGSCGRIKQTGLPNIDKWPTGYAYIEALHLCFFSAAAFGFCCVYKSLQLLLASRIKTTISCDKLTYWSFFL